MPLTIANGGTTSNSLEHLTGSMTINGPAALTGTVKVEVSPDGGTTWNVLSASGTDVTVAAAKAVVISGNFGRVRVKSGSAEGAERIFLTSTTRTTGQSVASLSVTSISSSGALVLSGIVTKATADSPYALAATDYTLLANTVAGDITVTLPASPTTGRIVNIKKIDAANNLTIDGNGKNIDGAATVAVTDNYVSLALQYTGTEWSKI